MRIHGEHGAHHRTVALAAALFALWVALLWAASRPAPPEPTAATAEAGPAVAPPPAEPVPGPVPAQGTGRGEAEPQPIRLEPVTLDAGRTVSGRVIDADTGAPLASARVAAVLEEGEDPGAGAAITDAGGAFALRHLPEHVVVRVEREGYLAATRAVGPGDGMLTVKLGRGGVLSVRLLSAEGVPLERRDIEVVGAGRVARAGHTDAAGVFEAALLAPGDYTVRVRTAPGNPGLTARTVEVGQNQRLRLVLREVIVPAEGPVAGSGP